MDLFETEWMDLHPYPGPPERRTWINVTESVEAGVVHISSRPPGGIKVGDIWFDNAGSPAGVVTSIGPEPWEVAVAFDGTFRRR